MFRHDVIYSRRAYGKKPKNPFDHEIREKKDAMRHVPEQHRARSRWPAKKNSSARVARGVNQQSYGGPITIRRALISHNAPFFLLGRTTAGRDRTGCTWPTIASEEGRLEPIDFHDFSISPRVKGERALPPSYPGRVLYDKNLIRTRRDEAFEILAGVISCTLLDARDRCHTWPYSHLLRFFEK